MVSVQVVGHVCIDLTPELHSNRFGVPGELTGVGPIEIREGGSLSNCGRALSALGVEAFLSGMVGADELGVLCRNKLEALYPGHVDLAVSQTRNTSYSIVIRPPRTDRSFWHHTGANDEFKGECAVQSNAILHFGYPSLCPAMCENSGAPIVKLFQRAHDERSVTSLDLAYLADNSPLKSIDWHELFANTLPHTDIFCPSWDDIASCIPDVDPCFDEGSIKVKAQEFLDQGAGVVLITAGKHGAYLTTGSASRLQNLAELTGIRADEWANQKLWDEAVPVEQQTDQPLDSNGAGDTFKAAFLVALIRQATATQAVRFASAVVARKLIRQTLDVDLEEI